MEKPIRVLAIVRQLKPGGLENRLMDIIRNIDNSIVIIDIYTYEPKPGIYDEEVKQVGGKVYYNPPLTVKNALWYVRFFRDFLKAHPEYQIVHAHQDAWCSVFCKGAYLAGVPVRIAHSRTAISSKNIGYVVKNIIKLPTRMYANYFFAVSGKAGRWLYGDSLYRRGFVQIWPNAIDAEKFYYNKQIRKKVRDRNGWNEKYVVMHVGNFTQPKNHPFILKVFAEVHKQDMNTILVLVGTGERENIDKYIEEHNLRQYVYLLGTRTDVNELLQGADVFLFPSIFEGLPGAMVEAQAAGLPCVMSDTLAEEIQITPNLTIQSLDEEPTEWARCVMKYKGFERKDTRKFIEEKGFDVNSLAKKLCEFYKEANKKGENRK